MAPVTFGPAAGTAAPGIAPVTFGAAAGTVAPGAAAAPLAPAVARRYRRSQHSVCHRCAISDYFASARSATTPVAATSGTGTDGTATNRDFADAAAVTVPISHVAELEVTAAAGYQTPRHAPWANFNDMWPRAPTHNHIP